MCRCMCAYTCVGALVCFAAPNVVVCACVSTEHFDIPFYIQDALKQLTNAPSKGISPTKHMALYFKSCVLFAVVVECGWLPKVRVAPHQRSPDCCPDEMLSVATLSMSTQPSGIGWLSSSMVQLRQHHFHLAALV